MNKALAHIQINVRFGDALDLLEALDRMAADDFTNRSAFLKRLIRQEMLRRRELAKAAREASRGRNVAATLQGTQGD